jgi:murein DD-endopeptidase MepM/ murein hydrolase activator NlpD
MAGRMTGWWKGAGAAVLVAACGPKALHHTVQPGESVAAIARHYGVPYEDLVRANRLRHPEQIVVGRRLVIPGVTADTGHASGASAGGLTPIGFAPLGTSSEAHFQWPVPGGAVTSPFGRRDHGHHDGIDVQAPMGTAVRAARGGSVLYSGTLRGYGNLVIVDHGAGFATVYAHNQQNLVGVGDRVRSGQTIALVGATGQVSAPHLHFEVRRRNVAQDPLLFLPPMSVASRRTESGR